MQVAMNVNRSLIALTLSFCLSTFAGAVVAADGDDALFGLRWGMTLSGVKALGIVLTKTEDERNFEIYKTSSLPKNISDVESYSVIFADGKLVKVLAESKIVTNDPSGSNGKERFKALRSLLSEKYGKPDIDHQVVGGKLFKEDDEFYECLAYNGCGLWVSVYESADKILSVELNGLRHGSGFISITAEAKPQFLKAVEVHNSRKNKLDKDSL
jgi:hypothetical protein